MRWTNHPRIFLEVAVVKLCQMKVKDSVKQMNSTEIDSLLSKISSLEEQLSDLRKNGIVVTNDQAANTASQAKPARTSRRGFQAPTGKINEILKSATKPDLTLVKSKWGELLGKLVYNQMRSQAALLNEAEPVAASTTALVISFKYEIHCQMAMDNDRFLTVLSDLTQELIGRRLSVVGVPEEQWQTIRAGFIKTNRDGESDQGDAGKENEEDPVVSEAIKLFGSELVEIKE